MTINIKQIGDYHHNMDQIIPEVITDAILECPLCHSKYPVKMPLISKHLSSRCNFCYEVFHINVKDECCVYCTYSNTSCPNSQKLKQ